MLDLSLLIIGKELILGMQPDMVLSILNGFGQIRLFNIFDELLGVQNNEDLALVVFFNLGEMQFDLAQRLLYIPL